MSKTQEATQRELLLEIRAMIPGILLTKLTPSSTVEQKIKDLPYQQLLDFFATIPTIKEKLSLIRDLGIKEAEPQLELRDNLYKLLDKVDSHHSFITDKITETMDTFSVFLNECEAEFLKHHGISKEIFREGVRRFNSEIDILILIKDSPDSAETAISNCLYNKDQALIKQDLLSLSLNIQNGLL